MRQSSLVIQGYFRGSMGRTLQAPPSRADVRPVPGAAGRAVAVQRLANGEARQLPANLANFGAVPGQPLPPPVLQKMESFFRTDFADVRVHVGPQAPSLGALAFTHGSNIYFAPGEYNPSTPHGQRLLGHELAHVVQQRTGRVRNPFGAGLAVVQDLALEAEADRMGRDAALHQMPVQPKLNAAAPPVRPATRAGSANPVQPRVLALPRPVPQRRPVAQPRTLAGGRTPSVLQPKVVVHGAGHDPRGDYALMKVLHQVTQASGAGHYVTDLDSTTDFSGMSAGEILYIVGHGHSGTGDIRGLATATLLSYLNHPVRGVPANIGGINILTCYSGMVKTGGQTLAAKVAAGLTHAGITVKGATGYAYGTPETARTGLNSVLSTDLGDFYSQSGPIDTMLQQLKDAMAAHGVNGSALYKSEGTSDDALRTWIRKFMDRRDTFEKNMKTMIASYSGRGSLNAILEDLRRDHKFQRLVRRQYELHQYLFTPSGTDYVSATS